MESRCDRLACDVLAANGIAIALEKKSFASDHDPTELSGASGVDVEGETSIPSGRSRIVHDREDDRAAVSMIVHRRCGTD